MQKLRAAATTQRQDLTRVYHYASLSLPRGSPEASRLLSVFHIV